MTRLLVSTVHRRAPNNQTSGFLYLVDFENQQVLQRSPMIEPAFREADPNPRGGLRGGRGIAIRPDQIAIANASVIFRYDPHWNLLGIISHPRIAGIQEILFENDTLWVTSARNDLLFQVDLSGVLLRHFYLREPSPAIRRLGWKPALLLKSDTIRSGGIDFRDPRTHDEKTYNQAQVNSLCQLNDGKLLVSLGLVQDARSKALLKAKNRLAKAGLWPKLLAANRKLRSTLRLKKRVRAERSARPVRGRSAVFEVHSDGSHRLVLALDEASTPGHSLLVLPDGTATYLNTTAGSVVHFDPQGGEVLSMTRVTDGMLCGAAGAADGGLLLGCQDEILAFDLQARSVIQKLVMIKDEGESIFDLQVLPEGWDIPPESFEDHFNRANGFRGSELPKHNYVLRAAPNVNIAGQA